jgi:hypothetical protein
MRGKTLESEVQRAICDYLAYTGIFFWRSNNVPVFGKSGDGIRRYRALPKYTPKGLPDIICIKNGHFIALEVKREGMKQTPDQKLMQNNIEENGGYYYVVYGISCLKKIDFFK